jgi:hypothetical protein
MGCLEEEEQRERAAESSRMLRVQRWQIQRGGEFATRIGGSVSLSLSLSLSLSQHNRDARPPA